MNTTIVLTRTYTLSYKRFVDISNITVCCQPYSLRLLKGQFTITIKDTSTIHVHCAHGISLIVLALFVKV